jgi:dnd system-associated protein 4
MTETNPTRDIIYIDESVHDIYKQLSEGGDPEAAPFKTMKDVFMWAASLGYRMGERRPLTGKRVMIFRWAQFSNQVDVPLIKAIAISDSSQVGILASQNDILTAAEEFANAGVYELRSVLIDEHGQPLWNLTSLIVD